jgi:ribonuclease P protein component
MIRLRSWDDFQKVMREGEIVSRSQFFVLHLTTDEKFNSDLNLSQKPLHVEGSKKEVQMRAGALVPKRWAKRAVTRNTLKRLIYAHLELNELFWPKTHVMVIRLKKEIGKKEFISATSSYLKTTINADLTELFKKVQTL